MVGPSHLVDDSAPGAAAALPRLYVMDISYFSGKVEAYLRYQGIAYERVLAGLPELLGVVGPATGVYQVPAMRLPDGGWLRESTAMLHFFEASPGTTTVLPPRPADAFLAALVEDYFDEWLWRPAMWWRWVPRESRALLGRRIAKEVLPALPLPTALVARVFARRQVKAWLTGDGMHAAVSDAVRDMYREELTTLEAMLAQQPFLAGSHPGLIDFGAFGSMFRHFFCDPDPGRVMRAEAPRVAAWVERLWSVRASDLPSTPSFSSMRGPAFDALYARIARRYLPYLKRNACALRDGERRFDIALDFGVLRGVRTHVFRVAARNALRRAFFALDTDAQNEVRHIFSPHGSLADLVDGETIPSGLDEPLVLPIAAGRRRSTGELLRHMAGSLLGREPAPHRAPLRPSPH